MGNGVPVIPLRFQIEDVVVSHSATPFAESATFEVQLYQRLLKQWRDLESAKTGTLKNFLFRFELDP